MGWAARANPRSFAGGKSERTVKEARIRRFCECFPTREQFAAYLGGAKVTQAEWTYLMTLAPERLQGVMPSYPPLESAPDMCAGSWGDEPEPAVMPFSEVSDPHRFGPDERLKVQGTV